MVVVLIEMVSSGFGSIDSCLMVYETALVISAIVIRLFCYSGLGLFRCG